MSARWALRFILPANHGLTAVAISCRASGPNAPNYGGREKYFLAGRNLLIHKRLRRRLRAETRRSVTRLVTGEKYFSGTYGEGRRCKSAAAAVLRAGRAT